MSKVLVLSFGYFVKTVFFLQLLFALLHKAADFEFAKT